MSAYWPGEPREKHVKGRLPDLGEAAYRRRQLRKAFWEGFGSFGFFALCAFAWWLLSLAFCSGCIEVRHHFDPVPIELGWAPLSTRIAPDGGTSHAEVR